MSSVQIIHSEYGRGKTVVAYTLPNVRDTFQLTLNGKVAEDRLLQEVVLAMPATATAQNKTFYGQLNMYGCTSCGGHFLSKDVGIGTTPFMIRCVHCGDGIAQSYMYHVPQTILMQYPHRVEWYYPTDEDYEKLSLPEKSHCDSFRLLQRVVDPVKVADPYNTNPLQSIASEE